jgi:hypothetical protein
MLFKFCSWLFLIYFSGPTPWTPSEFVDLKCLLQNAYVSNNCRLLCNPNDQLCLSPLLNPFVDLHGLDVDAAHDPASIVSQPRTNM